MDAYASVCYGLEVGEHAPTTRPAPLIETLRAGLAADPVVAKAWLVEGKVPLDTTEQAQAVTLRVDALILIVDPFDADRQPDDEDVVRARHRQMLADLIEPNALPVVISLEAVDELRRITTRPDAIEIGGGVTYTDALPHLDRHFPSFGALVRRIGSRQIRNLGTIAGNLATASPIGDTIPCLIALDATVTLASRAGKRVLPVESFITGYRKSALAAGEVIAAICIPLLAAGQDFAAYKVCKRFDQDISTVVAAFRLERRGGKVAELRAAYGGLAARAMRAGSVEGAVKGRPWAPAWLADSDALLARDFTPIADHRGGATYRLRAAAGLLRRFQLETSLAEPMRVDAL